MKAIEIREKSKAELEAIQKDLTGRRDILMIQLRQKKAKNVKELRELKKDLARVITIIREK